MRTLATALLLLAALLGAGCDCWVCWDDCGCYDGCYEQDDCCDGCRYYYYYQSLSPEQVVEEHAALVAHRNALLASGGAPEEIRELDARIAFLEKSWTP